MLRITETVRSQMKIINEKFPKIRSRTTGEFIKLYTDNLEQFHELLTFAKKTKFNFMKLNPKRAPHQGCTERTAPQLQGRRNSKDLEELGFTPEKAQANLKKELKIYSNDTWNARLEALNTTDNSLWEAQRFLKNKDLKFPTLNCATGMLINPNQYGFTNKLSTLHPLLRLTESISEGFKKEEHGSGLSGYPESLRPCLDLGLTFKLITYDIPSPLIHLIHSYLTNRSFRIR
ncbi:hypothetical protein TNCV_1305161, partial [Trichonephila clavipes]